MANSIKKRGQKIIRRLSRASNKARAEGKEHIKENFLQRLSHIRNIRLLVLEWLLLAVILIVLSVAQAFWFANSYAENVFVNGGSYIEATVGRVNSMNPLFATTTSEKVLSRLMFATLTATDSSGHSGVGLANHITASEEGKVWKVRLRDNLKWSDGEPLTIDDVLFTIGLVQNPAVPTVYDSNLSGVRVSVDENNEIVFALPSAFADFTVALEIPIVPKHELEDAELKTIIEDDFSLAPVTSGAFTFNARQTTSMSDEEVIFLSANPYYYLNKPLLNSFAVHVYNDESDVIAAINSGAVTATAELTGLEANKITSNNFYRRETKIDAGVFMFMNMTGGALKNIELRRAVRQGLDLAAIRELAPGSEPLDYPLLASQIALSSYPSIPGYNHDAAAAKIANLSNENQITLSIATVNSGYLPVVAEEIKTELENLGLNVVLTTYDETQEFVANIVARRGYDILIYEIEMGADPDLLPYYHSSQTSTAGLNLSNYSNTMVDDLLVGARETLDNNLRARKYETFLSYWVDDVPAIGLYQANMTYFYNKNVRTYDENEVLVVELDRFMNVENWAANRGTKNLTP